MLKKLLVILFCIVSFQLTKCDSSKPTREKYRLAGEWEIAYAIRKKFVISETPPITIQLFFPQRQEVIISEDPTKEIVIEGSCTELSSTGNKTRKISVSATLEEISRDVYFADISIPIGYIGDIGEHHIVYAKIKQVSSSEINISSLNQSKEEVLASSEDQMTLFLIPLQE